MGFKVFRNDVWLTDINQEIQIPQENLGGLTEDEKFALIKTRIRVRLNEIAIHMDGLRPLQRLVRYRFNLIDQGEEEPEIPGP